MIDLSPKPRERRAPAAARSKRTNRITGHHCLAGLYCICALFDHSGGGSEGFLPDDETSTDFHHARTEFFPHDYADLVSLSSNGIDLARLAGRPPLIRQSGQSSWEYFSAVFVGEDLI